MQALAIATDRGSLTFTALRIQSSYLKKHSRVCFSNFVSFPKSRLLSRSSKSIVPVLVTASSSSSSSDDEDWDLDFDVLKNLNPAVRKRVKVLIEIENQYNELKAKFIEERSALEAKYLKLYQPLFTKRYEVVNGEEKGVSNFWLTVLKKNEITGKHITELDEGALMYLKDIKWSFLEESQGTGFKLEFCFDQKNPYFKNTVLTKEYYIRRPYFDWTLFKTEGTTNIEWYPGKRLISELSTNYQDDFVSFFNFFSPARYGICFLHNWEDMAKDVTFGLIIKHKIISHAVSWFTGHNEKHVEVLREIQKQYDELEAKYLDERAALEAKYDKLYQPLYTQRYEIVNGVVEVEGVMSEQGEAQEKGVPNFWLNALKSSSYGFFAIKERDEGALKYLKDIKWTRIEEEEGAPNWWSMPDELKWCKIEFFFDQKNPYFKNSVLTKTYHMVDGDVCHCLKKAIGTEIEWYPGNCLTTKPTRTEEDFASFFDFFSPPPDHYEEFLIALAYNYQIIPGAVSLFLNPVPKNFMKTMTKKSSASQVQ